MPILRAVLMTRQAISPRLAIRIFLNMARASERNVVVLLPRILELLVTKERERPRNADTRGMRHDDFVDIATLGCDERIEEAVFVGLGVGRDLFRIVDIRTVNDLHRTLRTHQDRKSTRLNS